MTAAVRAASRPIGDTGGPAAEPVVEHVLDNGRLRLVVWSYGATVVEVSTRDATNLVYRLPALADYLRPAGRAYVGSTLGRFARLVAGGRAEIGGRTYLLDRNAGDHHIHGGGSGFDARVWTGTATAGDPGRIELALTSPDGDQGYPGTVRCTAEFRLDSQDRITVEYRAGTDRPTLLGLSSHIFWNLAGRGRIDDHLLQVAATESLEADEDLVPTGRLVGVAGTVRDFRQPRRLADTRIDDCYALRPGSATPQTSGCSATPQTSGCSATPQLGGSATPQTSGCSATLHHPGTGRLLQLSTSQPGLAVYTGDGLPDPRAGICLQPGPWPDAPNQPGFPTAELLPGQHYQNTATFSRVLPSETQGAP